jgi:5-bromo-4-chloroindolyl phosphate hydrolysis protein
MTKVDRDLDKTKQIVADLDQRIIEDIKQIENQNGTVYYESKNNKGNNR